MKMTSVVKCLLPLVLFLVGGFITGCATIPQVDWDSRVGHYTYPQAVHELGLPNRQIRLSNGATEFKWFLPTGAAGGSGLGMNNPGINNNGINGMNNGLGVGHGVSPGAGNRYLQLTFDANGVLTAWSRNY